jgi:hypothetical protein
LGGRNDYTAPDFGNPLSIKPVGNTKPMTSGAGSSLHMEQVSLVATVKVASVSADEFHEITMKQTTIASFQILPYSFIVIFPPHSTLYNF